jgi:hypothetical protein
MRENFVQLLAVILEKRGVQQSNIDNCTWSLESLRGATKRDGIPTVLSRGSMGDPAAPEDVTEAEPVATSSSSAPVPSSSSTAAEVFDHSRCADCSYGYAMACDCMNHLTALQKQANDANTRLQLLVEARERMMESNELIIQLDQNPELRNSLINGLPLPLTPTKEQASSNTNNTNTATTSPTKAAETTKSIPPPAAVSTPNPNEVDSTMLVAEAISIDFSPPPVDY